MLFFYIRHGDPIYSPDSLTPLGKRQAEAAAKRLALYGLDEIYSSTSERAKQTAMPTCEILKKELHTLDFANESHAWQQLTVTRDGKRTWLFSDAESRKLFVSSEVRKLGDKWYEHPELCDTRYREGIE